MDGEYLTFTCPANKNISHPFDIFNWHISTFSIKKFDSQVNVRNSGLIREQLELSKAKIGLSLSFNFVQIAKSI